MLSKEEEKQIEKERDPRVEVDFILHNDGREKSKQQEPKYIYNK